MYIKHWLQEPLQKRQCQIIIDETMWQLSQQGIKVPKIIEREVASTQTNALGQPMRCYERWYEGSNDFYQQLLDLNYPAEFEIYFAKNLAGAVARGISLQNTINPDGKIVVGHHHELASILLVENLQTLIREKYAAI